MPQTISKNCLNCEIEFLAQKREVKRGNGKFCSLKCSSAYRTKLVIIKGPKTPNVSCAHCKKEFYLKLSRHKLSKSGLYFCCRAHKDVSQKIGGIKEIMPSHYGVITRKDNCKHYRKKAFSAKSQSCERCGYNSHPAAIIVHHIDRDRMNDDILNLEVLCANCHAIEHWGKEV